MNVSGRIKRAEEMLRLIGVKDEYCKCLMNRIKKIIDSVYDKTPLEETGESVPSGDYCNNCEKPVDLVLLDTIKNINLIYGNLTV